MGSFCLTPNTVFPICKVKIVKTLCVGARANIGSARVDCVNKKQHPIWIVHIPTIWSKSLLIINFVILSRTSVKKLETNFIVICKILSTFVEIVVIESTESYLLQKCHLFTISQRCFFKVQSDIPYRKLVLIITCL